MVDDPVPPQLVIDALQEKVEELTSALEEVTASRDEAEAELEKRDSEAFDVLRSVRDWFDNVILLKRPMTDPRKVVAQIERVLRK